MSAPSTTVGWVAPGTWRSVVEAMSRRPEGERLVLVASHHETEAAPVAATGLFGRGRRNAPTRTTELTGAAAKDLVDKAAAALGRPCETSVLEGRPERAVVQAVADADLLILGRDGDRSSLGPRSLGKATRFVMDHAPCTVALLWPGDTPDLSTLPAAPRGN